MIEELAPLRSDQGATKHSSVRKLRKEVWELKRVLAEKILEVDFSKVFPMGRWAHQS